MEGVHMTKPRARDLGIPFWGNPGRNNAITDVADLEVGYSTIITGKPEEYVDYDSPFARTGVTAILPRGKNRSAVMAGRHTLTGNGELTGVNFIDDYGYFMGPVMLTNTYSVGVVRDATYKWLFKKNLVHELNLFGEAVEGASLIYPVVGETFDGFINNINGFHVKDEHVFEALENAASGPIEEGNIGGGTGMQCHLFKGGSGTSSRVLSKDDGGYTVGIFVQANHGMRDRFTIRGVPVGTEISGCDLILNGVAPHGGGLSPKPGTGSIIVIVATDAPVSPQQLGKMAKRVTIGIGNLGGGCEDASGDIFLAFSTANDDDSLVRYGVNTQKVICHDAILNAMVAAETMTGINGNTLFALPHDQVKEIMKKFGQLKE
jgi:L-aminopeptidase/D-esterase-like protein